MTEIERIAGEMANCYLLTGKEGAVLVDTGETGDREKVLKKCRNKNVRLLVLTHGHIDHIQNAAFLAKKLQIPIGMNEKDVELIRNQSAQPLTGSGIFGRVVIAGDALMHMICPRPASIYGDKRKLLESTGRIAALGSREIYFGHGTPVLNS